MVTRSLFGFEARATGSWCGRRDLNPHGPCGPTDFLALYGFRRRPPLSQWGLGSGLSLHRARIWLRVSGAARLVSTPSRPFRAGLGSGSPRYRVPRLWAVLHRRFPGEHSSFA